MSCGSELPDNLLSGDDNSSIMAQLVESNHHLASRVEMLENRVTELETQFTQLADVVKGLVNRVAGDSGIL